MKHVLNNKTILITGSGSGIGKACALACAEHGATVILLGRNEKKLNQVYDRIINHNWPKPAIIPLDLEHLTPTIADELVTILTDNFGKLDGLVHNAAKLGSITPIEHFPPDMWLSVLQINLNAPFLLTKALIPLLKQTNDASVIFTLADVANHIKAYWGAYGVSKVALKGLMEMLSLELSNTNVRVNAINPGRARTNLRAKIYPAEAPGNNPLPKYMMEQYLYLLSSESQHIRGQQFDIKVNNND